MVADVVEMSSSLRFGGVYRYMVRVFALWMFVEEKV